MSSLLTNILTCSRKYPCSVQRYSHTRGCCCANTVKSCSTVFALNAIWLLPPLYILNVEGRRNVTTARSSLLICKSYHCCFCNGALIVQKPPHTPDTLHTCSICLSEVYAQDAQLAIDFKQDVFLQRQRPLLLILPHWLLL